MEREKRTDDRFYREQQAWLERHTKDADLLVCDTRTGQCTEAIYYSPMKKEQDMRDEYLRRFFQAVRDEELRQGGA
jgi:uncharacterized protein YecT (DUF1311 family)